VQDLTNKVRIIGFPVHESSYADVYQGKWGDIDVSTLKLSFFIVITGASIFR
jgi:hypothetical protein